MDLVFSHKEEETKDVYSFYFLKPVGFKFNPGQYINIKLINLDYPDQRGNLRQFTLSSSPREKLVRITTRISNSGFKRTLINLKPNEVVDFQGPFGSVEFTKKDLKNNHVFLAGGIGITPFISILSSLTQTKLTTKIILIYSNSDENFLFKNKLIELSKNLANLEIIFHNSSIYGHLKTEDIQRKTFSDKTKFWVIGSIQFVNAIEDMLEEIKIKSQMIITEKFTGY